jgi:hypothetical protein
MPMPASRTRLLSALLSISMACALPARADTPPSSTNTAPRGIAAQTAKLQAQPGFLNLWRDVDKGRVLISVSALDSPFLIATSLPYALGSNEVGLDRGQPGEVKVVRFVKRGARLFLIEDNTRFVANSSDADERQSAVAAFAGAVLWSGDILASEGGSHLVDFSSFLLADQHGIARRLANAKQGAYRVDEKRSAVLAEQAKSFPDNTELEAELTFQGPGEGPLLRRVAADPASLTLHQHISLVRLPGPGFTPRAYHPASGGNANPFVDFATPLADSIEVRWQRRHRLEKTDPALALSPVKKPIVYYLDRSTPEPVRSALLDGARWWATAFEKAGFKDAYRVELLPEGVDPLDIRYNVINWVHRDVRGWSYGSSLVDPRTGEIIKGVVTLGSQRVRQDILIAESLLAPYGQAGGAGADPARQGMAQQMAIARLRQLAAHEVGHTLGFAHNFAASRAGNASVMDYPHPLLTVGANGEIALGEPYGVGVGAWDDFIVAHAYTQYATPQLEAAGLAGLRAQARARHLDYVSDADARPNGASHPSGVMWDTGPDALTGWDLMMTARRRALQQFSIAVLPDARQTGELEARLVPVYLLHRYQVEAVARLVAGGVYEFATIGDVRSGASQAGVRTVPARVQRQALQKLADSLRAEQLALPANVLDLMTPPGQGYGRTPEYFATGMERDFDPYSAVEAGAAQTCLFLFDPARFNRLSWQHARDEQQPGVADTLDLVLGSSWKKAAGPGALPGGAAVQQASNWVVLDSVLRLLDSGKLHPQVDAEVRQSVRELAGWLGKNPATGSAGRNRREASELITRYLADPASVKLRPAPAIPPGAPI